MTIDCAASPVDAAVMLARGFAAGRHLVVCAPAAADHAHHVAVEFVHPVVGGTKALPAVAVDEPVRQAPDDVLLMVASAEAAERSGADLLIADRQPDVAIMASYHLLWELTQAALGGLSGGCAQVSGPDADRPSVEDLTGFLYPALSSRQDPHADAALTDALAASARAKQAEIEQLKASTLRANADAIEAVATVLESASRRGGRVFTMGNGGSATDAARVARLLRSLPVDAKSLAADYAILTALANDVGAERIFVRQLEAFGRATDVLIGFSTSGSSPNLLAAFDLAQRRNMTTVGVCGYGGGSFATHDSVEHLLSVESSSVHRIQEAQAAVVGELIARLTSATGMQS